MNGQNQEPLDELLNRAVQLLRNSLILPEPPDALVASTVEAVNRLNQSAQADERRRRIMRYLRYGSVAAAAIVLATLASIFWFGNGAAHASYEKALQNADKAKSFRATMKFSDGKGMDFQMKLYQQGDSVRIETEGVVAVIADGKKKTALQLDLKNKTAQKLDLEKKKNDPFTGQVRDFVKKLSERKDADVEALGDEMIDGRKTKVFAVKNVKLADKITDWKVWIDPKIEMPVRAQMTPREGPKMTVTYEYHGWNEALDAALFSLDVPKGYKLKE
jgi:outer membrane lipoprotein-sorting protein